MSLRRLIEDAYRERLALAPIPGELKQALRMHERVPLFFRNLERELSVLPPKFATPEHVRTVVYDMTDLFIKLVDRHAHERQKSDLAKAYDAAQVAKRNELASITEADHEEV